MQKLFYFNIDEIPAGVVTSTARLGHTWYDQVEVGDTVAVHRVGDKALAHYAVVVAKEFLSYEDVWDGAQHNSVGYGKPAEQARALLHQTICRAFGSQMVSMTEPCFSVLHLLPINNSDDISGDMDEAVLEANDRVVEVETTNRTLLGIIAQKVEEQEGKDAEVIANARATITEIHAMAIGHMTAAKEGGPFIRAVERANVIGDITEVLRIEF